MATHSSVLAWRIPGTGEPGGLPSMGSHRVGHDWLDLTAAAATWPWVSYLSESPPPCLKNGGIPMFPTLLRQKEQNEVKYLAHCNCLAKADCYTTMIKLRRFCVAHHSFIHESSQMPMMCQALCLVLELKRWIVKTEPHSQDPHDRSSAKKGTQGKL